MRILLNILWIVFGGLISALGFFLAGCFWGITIIGIPVAKQCFKLASISLNPFGKEIIYEDDGAGSFILNILWFIISGWELAITNFLIGCILCITIIGIPWGKQYFKIAKVALRPFGIRVEREHIF